MMKNPDIILLDEPTSALDSENEELVTQALDNLFKNKTVIVVAHRLQTVKQSDLIIYIDRPSNTKFEKTNDEDEEIFDDFSYVAEQ
jgi:ABC-type multidrug transport system fused ATPase/permease subunit